MVVRSLNSPFPALTQPVYRAGKRWFRDWTTLLVEKEGYFILGREVKFKIRYHVRYVTLSKLNDFKALFPGFFPRSLEGAGRALVALSVCGFFIHS